MISVLPVSCGTIRKVSEGSIDTAVTRQMSTDSVATANDSVSGFSVDSASVSKVTTLSEGETMITEVFDYDTNRQIDSTTGTPPLKRYMRQERRRDTQRKDSTVLEHTREICLSAEAEASVVVSNDTHIDEETHETFNTDERQDVPRILIILSAVGVAFILITIIYVLTLFRRRF